MFKKNYSTDKNSLKNDEVIGSIFLRRNWKK